MTPRDWYFLIEGVALGILIGAGIAVLINHLVDRQGQR